MSKKENSSPIVDDKYKDKNIRFLNKGDHYELIFADEFNYPTSAGGMSFDTKPETNLLDIIQDMREADKNKELHIFVGSFGGLVVGLNMILEQVQEFKYRVGINLGMACSCGFMMLAYCNEIYTSPYAEFMYHAMSGGSFGKVEEMVNHVVFNRKWWELLLKNSFITEILTEEELKLGETTEVWLTGQDLIDRNIALPYSLYANRSTPVADSCNFFVIGKDVYRKEGFKYIKYVPATNAKTKFWFDLVNANTVGSFPAEKKTVKKKKK